MNPLPLREPRKAQRNRDRGPWSPFTPRPRRRCPSPRRTYRQGTVIKVSRRHVLRATTVNRSPSRASKSYLSDILVSHPADLLDVCGRLGDGLEGVAGQDQLVLLGLGDLDLNTGLHDDSADELLADEVSVRPGKSASTSPHLHWTTHDGPWRPIPGSLSNAPSLPNGNYQLKSGFPTYRISTSKTPSEFLSRLTLMGKWA